MLATLSSVCGWAWGAFAAKLGAHVLLASAAGMAAFVVVWTLGADIITFDLYDDLTSDVKVRHPGRYPKYLNLALRAGVLICLAAASAPLVVAAGTPRVIAIPFALVVPLLVMKVFQPQSVALYFSERLQDAHALYRSGVFAEMLDPMHRDMPPHAFEHWYRTFYRPEFALDRRQRHRLMQIELSREKAEEIQNVVLFALNDSTINPVREERLLLNA
ncbi:MAG TPA: hypothetical protein VGQ36_03755 [Thermoanaerobaculia bacterium]|jgi:hypothetical protein|nr:hypothetical protein [Thermoanaerobaculia bacterium]